MVGFIFMDHQVEHLCQMIIIHKWSGKHPNHMACYREASSTRALLHSTEFSIDEKRSLVLRAVAAHMKIKRRRPFSRIRELACTFCNVRVSIYS